MLRSKSMEKSQLSRYGVAALPQAEAARKFVGKETQEQSSPGA